MIVIDTTRYKAYSYGGLYFKLVHRIVVVDQKDILADWRVQCEAPTLITQDDPLHYAPDLDFEHRLPLKTYTEALHELSQILYRKYIAFHDRDNVLDSLRLSLLLDRTTDIGQNIYIRNYALRVNCNCWCRSRRTLVDLEMLLEPQLGGKVPNDLVARARGIMQFFLRIAEGIPKPNTTQIYHWTPTYEWFSLQERVHEFATSLMLKQRAKKFGERMRRVRQEPFGRLGPDMRRNQRRRSISESSAVKYSKW